MNNYNKQKETIQQKATLQSSIDIDILQCASVKDSFLLSAASEFETVTI